MIIDVVYLYNELTNGSKIGTKPGSKPIIFFSEVSGNTH